jgi:hypothetical protein
MINISRKLHSQLYNRQLNWQFNELYSQIDFNYFKFDFQLYHQLHNQFSNLPR